MKGNTEPPLRWLVTHLRLQVAQVVLQVAGAADGRVAAPPRRQQQVGNAGLVKVTALRACAGKGISGGM